MMKRLGFVPVCSGAALILLLCWSPPLPAQISRMTPVVQAVRKCKPCVVQVTVTIGEGEKVNGSGVIVDESGIVITNAHVVQTAKKATVRLHDETRVAGEVLAADPSCDLAVIRLKGDRKYKAVMLTSIDDLEVGESVIAIGSPYGYFETVTMGIVSALHRVIEMPSGAKMEELIQVDAPINPGNSGGALLNINGELIGINTAVREGANSLAFAINANTVMKKVGKHLPSSK
jgi:serine protease Do